MEKNRTTLIRSQSFQGHFDLSLNGYLTSTTVQKTSERGGGVSNIAVASKRPFLLFLIAGRPDMPTTLIQICSPGGLPEKKSKSSLPNKVNKREGNVVYAEQAILASPSINSYCE